MDRSPVNSRKIVTAAVIIAVLIVGTLLLGSDFIGKFCLVLVPIMIGAQALKTGRFSLAFGKHYLNRTSDPTGYWMAMALCLAVAAAQVWYTIDDLILHSAR